MHSIQQVKSDADIEQVASLAHEIWNEHFPQIIGQDQVDYMVGNLQSIVAINAQIKSGYDYYVLWVDDAPVGYLGLIPDSPKGRMMISKFYIKHEMRGTGFGQLLLNFVKDLSVQNSFTTIHLTVNRDNKSSIDWYLHHGFEITGEIKKDIGSGFIMDDYTMELSLTQRR